MLCRISVSLAVFVASALPQTGTVAHQPWLVSTRGSEKAPVTVIVFSDFESFPCSRAAAVLSGVVEQRRDVRVIFKHAPAATNPNAMLAHEAALAAGAQGKFWEMHDLLFKNQTKLSHADLIGYAKSLRLDLPTFQQALDKHIYRQIVERDLAEAKALGVTTTPTFFVNGRRLVGPQGYSSLGAVIETVLAGIPQSQRVPAEIIASGPAQEINLQHAPTRGPATAPISLVEFSDFECPLLCPGRTDRSATGDRLPNPGAVRLQALPVVHAQGIPSGSRGCAGRWRPGQVLGDARRPVRWPGQTHP